MRFLAGSIALTLAALLVAAAQTNSKSAPKAHPPAASSKSKASPPAPADASVEAAEGAESVPSQGIAAGTPTRRLTFGIEWKLIRAGRAQFEWRGAEAKLDLESEGMVSKLYTILDHYQASYEEDFCVTGTHLDASEGKRHRDTRVVYDRNHGHAFYTEKDLLAGKMIRSADVATPSCVHDVLGALLSLKHFALEPGKPVEVPVSDGRKFAMVRIEPQEREMLKTAAGTFDTVRLEVFLLNGVVYGRKGRLQVWVTDDSRKLPVRFLLKMGFPLGNINVDLEKEEIL